VYSRLSCFLSVHLSTLNVFSDFDGLCVWRVKRCGQELELAKEPNSNQAVKRLMREKWAAVTWHHNANLLYILDKEGKLITVRSRTGLQTRFSLCRDDAKVLLHHTITFPHDHIINEHAMKTKEQLQPSFMYVQARRSSISDHMATMNLDCSAKLFVFSAIRSRTSTIRSNAAPPSGNTSPARSWSTRPGLCRTRTE
jgi:hypothetical protein